MTDSGTAPWRPLIDAATAGTRKEDTVRYFVDTEFNFDAERHTVDPISVGIVAEDGREFFAVSSEYNRRRLSPWLRANVVAKLPDPNPDPYDSPRLRMEAMAWMKLRDIHAKLLDFIGSDIPEFWGDYAAFDYVVLNIIMGGFDNWPQGWPMHVNDLQQDAIPSIESKVPHHALHDARAVRDAYDWAFRDPHPVVEAGQ